MILVCSVDQIYKKKQLIAVVCYGVRMGLLELEEADDKSRSSLFFAPSALLRRPSRMAGCFCLLGLMVDVVE